ncbi:MAG: PKD domain-containing protein, partial [Promethearchaeota archaeon]
MDKKYVNNLVIIFACFFIGILMITTVQDGNQEDYLFFAEDVLPSEDGMEPNDDFASAWTVVSQKYFGLSCEDDDYFKVYAYTSQYIDVWLTFSNFIGDLDLYIYDSSQSLMNYSTSTTDNEYTFVEATYTGYYYILVCYVDNPNGYDLEVAVDDGCEPNDNTATAFPVGLETLNTLAMIDNNDWYSIDLESEFSITVNVYFAHGQGNIDVELYNPSVVLVASSTSTTDDEQIQYTASANGTYYIRVFGEDNPIYSMSISGEWAYMNVTTPNATSSWENGSSHMIYWDTYGYIPNVHIMLWNDTSFYRDIATVPNTGSYLWNIPSDVPPSNYYFIYIEDTNSPAWGDSEYFQIWRYNNEPYANFTANASSIYEGEYVQFTFIGDNGDIPTTYQWDFGDGTPNSTDKDPIHQYNVAGYYNVTMTVTDMDGDSSTLEYIDFIEVLPGSPWVDFVANVTWLDVGGYVQFNFTGFEGNPPAMFQWDFGDGSVNSSLRDPIHQYNNEGNFTVTLTVIDNDLDADTYQVVDCIEVVRLVPYVNVSANATTILEGESIQFTFTGDEGSSPATFQWNFGDGTSNSTEKNPTHQYTAPGNYTLTLTVVDNDGDSDTYAYIDVIEVLRIVPVANFSVDFNIINAGSWVQFTFTGDDGTPSPSFQWDFGDGTANSTDRDPQHQYLSEGNYTVTLTVTDGDGDSDTEIKVDYITVIAGTVTQYRVVDMSSGEDLFMDLAIDTETGNYYVTGYQNTSPKRAWLFCYAPNMTMLWNQSYYAGLPYGDIGTGVSIHEGYVYWGIKSEETLHGWEPLLRVHDKYTGAFINQTLWGTSTHEHANELAVDQHGNWYWVGSIDIGGTSPYNIWIKKMFSNGTESWAHDFGDYNNNGYSYSVKIDNDGNIVVVGISKALGPGNPSSWYNIWLGKFSPDGTILWTDTWGAPDESDLNFGGLTFDNDNNIYVSYYINNGSGIYDAGIFKYYPNGTLAWGGRSNPVLYANTSSVSELFMDVCFKDGFLYACGSRNQSGNEDILIAKFDLDGILLWNYTWGGSAEDRLSRILIDLDYNIVASGYTKSWGQVGYWNGLLVKVNQTLDLIPVANFSTNVTVINKADYVQFTFTGQVGDSPASFQWDFGDGSANSTDRDPLHQYLSEGNYTVILTITDGDGDSDTEIRVDYIIVVSGEVLNYCFNDISSDEDFFMDLAIDTETGNYYVTGYQNTSPKRAWLFCYAPNMTMLWNQSYYAGLPYGDIGTGVSIHEGYVYWGIKSEETLHGWEPLLRVHDKYTGAFINQTLWGTSTHEHANELAVDQHGNWYWIGSIDIGGTSPYNIWIKKMFSNGTESWAHDFGDYSNNGYSYSVKIDNDDNIVVVGISKALGPGNPSSWYNIWLGKFSPDGTILWTDTWGAPNESDLNYGGLTFDNDNNIYVSYYINNGSGICDAGIFKYYPNGTLAWGGRSNPVLYANTSSVSELFMDVCFKDGFLYACGSTNQSGNEDILIARFDLDGILLWNYTWGGSAEDRLSRILFDLDYNIVASGYTKSWGQVGYRNGL